MTSSAWHTMIESYLTFREVSQGRSQQTSIKYRLYLIRLLKFCEQASITPAQATPDHLEAFTGVYVFKEMNMGPHARRAVVAAVKGFYKWMTLKNIIEANPSENVQYPKAPRKLPLAMPLDAAERLIWAPDMNTFTGLRDATMLALLIGCGLRAAELVQLNTKDLLWSRDSASEYLSFNIIGKGKKNRVVPAPEDTRWMMRAYMGHHYLKQVNRRIDISNEVLFISTANRMIPESSRYGEAIRLSTGSVRKMITKYGKQADIPRQYLHPHAIRHLFGKELTEGDVDVLDRMVLMGHSDVQSAEIYSHIVERKKRAAIEQHSAIHKMKSPVTDIRQYFKDRKT